VESLLLEPLESPAPRSPSGDAEPRLARLDARLVSLVAPASFAAEQYRALRHPIEQMHRSRGLSVIAVTSAAYGDGKTVTAINLAGALAQVPEARILLAELDLRRPSLAARLGVSEQGLVEAILDPGRSLDDVVQRLPGFNLSVLPAGRRIAAPYEALRSARLGELVTEARHRYDYIVLDTVPLPFVTDTRLIGPWIDGFLLVILADRTPQKLVEEALNAVERDKMIGLVFNGDTWPLASDGAVQRRVEAGPWNGSPGGTGKAADTCIERAGAR